VFLLLSALAPPALAQGGAGQAPSGPPPVTTPAFVIQSDGGDNRLQIGGFLQMEGRFVAADDQRRVSDTFTMRRFRFIFQGRLARHFDYYWNVDFSNNVLTLRDGYFDTVFSPALHVRVGKMKAPFSYDRLLLVTQTLFQERGMTTSVAPDRDTGVQVLGDLAGGLVSYAGMVGNGTADGQLSELDTNDAKDVIGRVMIRPWARRQDDPLATFAAGIAASTGVQAGPVPTFLSPARQPFFSYAAGSTGEGRRNRWSPQAVYFHGPFWGYAEYVSSTGSIRRDGVLADVEHRSWQVAGSWVVTGEAAPERNVRPRGNFDPPSNHWGALQLVARYQQFRASSNAFELGMANAGASRTAESVVVGANWYMNPLVKWYVNFERTVFDGSVDAARHPENSITFQGQFGF
jgi:phosphate-selective porin OprO/OprP